MANPVNGEATFADGAVQHKVVVNWGVLIEVEQESGVPLLSPDLFMRIGFLSSLLRFGLHAAGGQLVSRQQAADMIARIDGAREALKTAFMGAMPQDPAEGGPEGNV
jgi:hypothetical protein